MNIIQRTTLPFLAQEEYLELLIEGFLTLRKAKNVTAGTLKFYNFQARRLGIPANTPTVRKAKQGRPESQGILPR
jgi:hypothetical protein